MITDWHGVFPALTTQFKKDQSLDLDATCLHIDAVLDSGVSGLVMLGSLGENNALLPDEKRRVMDMAIHHVGGAVPVIAGVAESSTAAACQYARDVQAMGVDGLMVLPAMSYHADYRETIAHFREVSESTGLPVIAYNNPIAYRVDITPTMFEELAGIENIVAIKESSADVRRITDIINLLGDRYLLFTGVDDLALESIALGCRGWISGVGLAFPKANQHLWNLAISGQWKKALEIYRWYMPVLHLDTHVKFVQYIKLAIQETGLGKEWVRSPRLPLVDSERTRILSIIHTAIETHPDLN